MICTGDCPCSLDNSNSWGAIDLVGHNSITGSAINILTCEPEETDDYVAGDFLTTELYLEI